MLSRIEGLLGTLVEALGIFSISMVLLYGLYAITAGQRATGMAWVNAKGLTLIGVGLMYIVAGAVLLTLRR